MYDYDWMELVAEVQKTVMAIPGPFWMAATLALWGVTKLTYVLIRRNKGGPDNKTSLYAELRSLLREPAKWTRDGAFIRCGRASIKLPCVEDITTKETYPPRIGWFLFRRYATVTLTIAGGPSTTYQDAGKLMASFLGLRHWKITKMAAAMWHTQVEREGQLAAGHCLSSLRHTETPPILPGAM